MVIDTSAVLVVLFAEPEDEAFAAAIEADPARFMSAVSVLEASIVVEARKGPSGGRELDLLLHRAAIEIVPFTVEQLERARDAYRRFGRGNHPAALNFGDCCAYALATSLGEALLFKGDDFAQTDLRYAPASARP
jgi:ribonuclease VapC